MLKTAKNDKKLPKHWKKEVRTFYLSVVKDYRLDGDETALRILTTGCDALQKMRDCESIIQREGLTVKSRFGETRSHPLLTTQRDCHQLFLKSLKSLNLEIGDPNDVGKPAGSWKV